MLKKTSSIVELHIIHSSLYFRIILSLPVGEAASPGIFSSPDTRTFSGRRCIMETSAGCFLMAQSKWAPSIAFRRLLSAKTYWCAFFFNISHGFHDKHVNCYSDYKWVRYHIPSHHHPQPKRRDLSPGASASNISPEALSDLTTWHPTSRHNHFSIFHLRCWWPRCNVPLHCEHRFPGLNWNDNIPLQKYVPPEEHCSVDETWGMSNEQDIIIFQAGHPMTAHSSCHQHKAQTIWKVGKVVFDVLHMLASFKPEEHHNLSLWQG